MEDERSIHLNNSINGSTTIPQAEISGNHGNSSLTTATNVNGNSLPSTTGMNTSVILANKSMIVTNGMQDMADIDHSKASLTTQNVVEESSTKPIIFQIIKLQSCLSNISNINSKQQLPQTLTTLPISDSAVNTTDQYRCKSSTVSDQSCQFQNLGQPQTVQINLVKSCEEVTTVQNIDCSDLDTMATLDTLDVVAAGQQDSISIVTTDHQQDTDERSIFQCDLCSATFNRLGNYTRHRMIHTVLSKDDYRYSCKECGRLFLQKCDLKRHEKVHTGSEPYRCSVCSKGYIRQSDLRVHMRFHNKERSHQCEHCDKSFYQSGDLKRHVRLVHLQQKPLTCGHCTRRFVKEATLIRHMQTSHRDIILKSLTDSTSSDVFAEPSLGTEQIMK